MPDAVVDPLGGVGDFFSDPFGAGEAADDAADASTAAAATAAEAYIRGAEISAESQQQALDYLKGIEELPQEIREQALTQLASIFGLEGFGGTQQPQQPQYERTWIPGTERTHETYIDENGKEKRRTVQGTRGHTGIN